MQFQLSDVMPDRIADEQGVLTAWITSNAFGPVFDRFLQLACREGAETWPVQSILRHGCRRSGLGPGSRIGAYPDERQPSPIYRAVPVTRWRMRIFSCKIYAIDR